ncbi:MAG: 23S rRNA (pseudouridine(1915)-N(3))-methyltransferase RlmH [Bacillota bacterium]|jgi:23S rRNA (pseudouridine1915-N3)-methyltransferase|nr:23S rRNA (pseudouridine(1915)-N(3))-methyltransferase RlmH [Bacillota bacterium]
MIKIIAVGKIKEKSLKKLIDDYVKRISYYSSVKIIEVNDEPNNKKIQEEQIKNIEGQRVLKHIKDNDYVYLLDLNGKEYDSLSFSKSIDDVMTYKSSDIVFVIGGSLGLSDELIKRSDIRWKLSNCTFPHQIVRLLLVEQIYRAFSILNNLPYHK